MCLLWSLYVAYVCRCNPCKRNGHFMSHSALGVSFVF